jgi:hypothetical protein
MFLSFEPKSGEKIPFPGKRDPAERRIVCADRFREAFLLPETVYSSASDRYSGAAPDETANPNIPAEADHSCSL